MWAYTQATAQHGVQPTADSGPFYALVSDMRFPGCHPFPCQRRLTQAVGPLFKHQRAHILYAALLDSMAHSPHIKHHRAIVAACAVVVALAAWIGVPIYHSSIALDIAAAIIPDRPFLNRSFACPSRELFEPGIDRYPYPVRQFPAPPGPQSITALRAFCDRQQDSFRTSSMTNREAQQVYARFAPTVFTRRFDLPFQNECYGAPACDLVLFNPINQVMAKKIDNKTYDIFLYRTFCGQNYEYRRVHIENNEITSTDLLEHWSETFPC